MEMYRVPARRTVTEYGYLFVEADSATEARRVTEANVADDAAGRFEVEELVEESFDFEGIEETPEVV